MYILLSGARMNVGDYLILEKAKSLLQEVRPDRQLMTLSRFQPLDDKINLLNNSKAIILCGGPAYSKDVFPRIYPLVTDLSKLKVPIIPFGLGWSGKPMRYPKKFKFTPYSKRVLNNIHREATYSSCRDSITEQILNRHGYKNVLMTGCPVWYDIDSLGKKMDIPNKINTLVFTPPQKNKYHVQSKQLMEKIAATFPDAHKYCVFHRDVVRSIKSKARRLNFEVVEAAKDVSKIEFYRQCDLHLGYRVHAHLNFLSMRKPSFLLHEDGRGIGQSKTLGLSHDVTATTPDAINTFMNNVVNEMQNEFQSLAIIPKKIDLNYKTMKKFLKSLP